MLVLGFAVVFLLVIGDRIIPVLPVQAEQVVLVRQSEADVGGPGDSPSGPRADQLASGGEGSELKIPAKGSLLFQASGWIEPDPLPIKATALTSGVIDEVIVFEGQKVKKGDLLATLIKDDVVIDLQEAEQKKRVIEAQREAHRAMIPVQEARLLVARQNEEVEKANLTDAEDLVERLREAAGGGVPQRQVREAELKLASQRAKVDAASAQVRQESAELERIRTLQGTFDSQIREAQVVVDRQKLALERTKIKAPVDGVVLRLLAVPGGKRMLDMDDPDSSTVAILFQPEHLQVRADVPLAEAGRLSVGQPTTIVCDIFPDRVFSGVVTRIVGEADLTRNTLQATVRSLDPDPRLRPEMLCRVKFFAPAGPLDSIAPSQPGTSSIEGDKRFKIFAPLDGLVIESGEETATAWVVVGGLRAERRAVTLGHEVRDGYRAVQDGLKPGDRVIINPSPQLEPGRRLKLMEEPA